MTVGFRVVPGTERMIEFDERLQPVAVVSYVTPTPCTRVVETGRLSHGFVTHDGIPHDAVAFIDRSGVEATRIERSRGWAIFDSGPGAGVRRAVAAIQRELLTSGLGSH